MGFYESEYWLSDVWGGSRRERQSGTYHPFVPDFLVGVEGMLSPSAQAAIAQAHADIAQLDSGSVHLVSGESFARLLLRSEAMASSRIEGLQMSAGKLLEYEALDEIGVPHRVDGVEALVLANIDAMQRSVGEYAEKGEVSVSDICGINGRLLGSAGAGELAGVLRDRQNWIGGSGMNPVGAAYVPPKPEYVPALMDDLVRFVNESKLPAVAVAAIAHAQLETIHPFADGNGRTGRALIHIVLRQRGAARSTVPPVSLVLATDRENYIKGLSAFRFDEDSPRSEGPSAGLNEWVEFFCACVSTACKRAGDFEDTLCALQGSWRAAAKPRANSAADLLLGKLADNPVVSVESAARLTGRSYEAARKAVLALSEKGILTQNARNRKSNLFVAQDAIDAFTRFERALATAGGDTATEKPRRAVPQRQGGSRASSLRAINEARRRHRG